MNREWIIAGPEHVKNRLWADFPLLAAMSALQPPSLLSSLTNAAVNITALREAAWADLEALLADAPGKICLVVDPSLDSVLKLALTGGMPQLKVSIYCLGARRPVCARVRVAREMLLCVNLVCDRLRPQAAACVCVCLL